MGTLRGSDEEIKLPARNRLARVQVREVLAVVICPRMVRRVRLHGSLPMVHGHNAGLHADRLARLDDAG
jgi:hypothetical protein